MMAVVEKLKLSSGYEMPAYGLGTMFVSSSIKCSMQTEIFKCTPCLLDRLEKMLVYKRSKMQLILDIGILTLLTYMVMKSRSVMVFELKLLKVS